MIGPREGVFLGASFGRDIVTNEDFTAYVCYSDATRPSSQITLGRLVYNTRVKLNLISHPICGIEQVSSAKLLCAYIQENFSCDMHFKHIITVSSQLRHILKALRRQGLSIATLCVSGYMLNIVNKLMYAISARMVS